VTIFYGANDSSLLQLNSRQHVPLERYEENLGKIIDRFLYLGVSSDKIILIAPPPVDEKVGCSVFNCHLENLVVDSMSYHHSENFSRKPWLLKSRKYCMTIKTVLLSY